MAPTKADIKTGVPVAVGKALWAQNALISAGVDDSDSVASANHTRATRDDSDSVSSADQTRATRNDLDSVISSIQTRATGSQDASKKVEAEDTRNCVDAMATLPRDSDDMDQFFSRSADGTRFVASDGSLAVTEAGKTDHSPFSIEGSHLGMEPFPSRILDFLKTAPRSGKPARNRCVSQKRAFFSQCPAWEWLTMYHGPVREKRPAVFVDIGCNKGYSVASFFDQFAPKAGISKKHICKVHQKLGTGKFRGVCGDCDEHARPGTGSGHKPKVYCIDGSPYTHNRTKEVKSILSHDLASGWKLFHQAMTNASGTISYEDCGVEDCGINRPGDKFRKAKRSIVVPAMTYDSFAEAQGISFADLVKIDTEGEEPLIIQGMHEALKAKRVGFLAFEVHGTGKGWYRAFDMQRLVDLLDAYGYTCYMDAMQGRLALLTGCHGRRYSGTYCYTGSPTQVAWYEKMMGMIPQWGNAICGLRANKEIKTILENLLMHPIVRG